MLKLNLGCGYRKLKGFTNIDNRPEVKPDMVWDVRVGLPYNYPSMVDEIRAIDFLEHLERHEVIRLMEEIWCCLKPGGKFYHETPSTDGRGAFQDPFHKSFWNINTWRYYFVDPHYLKLYGFKCKFKIINIQDVWTDEPNKILHTHCLYEAVKDENNKL